MIRTFIMLRSLLSLVLLLSCSEAFSRETQRPNLSILRPQHSGTNGKGHTVEPLSKSSSSTSPTALSQTSSSSPLDESLRSPLVERLRSSVQNPVITLRAGAQQAGSLLERHPFTFAVSITTVNAVLADLLSQLVFTKGSPWNPKRSVLFAAFGFLYQGCAQYAIVNGGWERLFPGSKPKAVIAKICGMNLLSDPLLFMPTFYIFKEFMTAGTLSWGMIKAALLSYKANAVLDWRNSWLVWFPGHAVTYGVMPAHKRIPWMAFLSFFYMCILSLTRGGA